MLLSVVEKVAISTAALANLHQQLHTRAVLRDPTNVLSLGPFAVKAYVAAPGDLVRAQAGNRLRSVPVIL